MELEKVFLSYLLTFYLCRKLYFKSTRAFYKSTFVRDSYKLKKDLFIYSLFNNFLKPRLNVELFMRRTKISELSS